MRKKTLTLKALAMVPVVRHGATLSALRPMSVAEPPGLSPAPTLGWN
jgi:hypothetical protein